jgi:hypothetical protein
MGLRQITPAAKSLYRSFFSMTTFCIAFYESYLSTVCTMWGGGGVSSVMAGSLKVFLEGSGVLNR